LPTLPPHIAQKAAGCYNYTKQIREVKASAAEKRKAK